MTTCTKKSVNTRKCDYWRDRWTDSDPCVPLCFTGDTEMVLRQILSNGRLQISALPIKTTFSLTFVMERRENSNHKVKRSPIRNTSSAVVKVQWTETLNSLYMYRSCFITFKGLVCPEEKESRTDRCSQKSRLHIHPLTQFLVEMGTSGPQRQHRPNRL